jgi:hypothetical protein
MQTDPQYNQETITDKCYDKNGNLVNQKVTMAKMGCGPTSVANILRDYGIETNPLALAKRIPSWTCGGTGMQSNIDLLESFGLQVDGYPPSLYTLNQFSADGDHLFIGGNSNGIDHFNEIKITEDQNGNQSLTLIDSYFSDSPLNCKITGPEQLECSGKNKSGQKIQVNINYSSAVIVSNK